MSITHNITRACVAAAYGQDQLNTLPQLDGLTATMMDEAILMREPLLKRYWSSVLTFSQARCRELVTGNNNALQVSMYGDFRPFEAVQYLICNFAMCSDLAAWIA